MKSRPLNKKVLKKELESRFRERTEELTEATQESELRATILDNVTEAIALTDVDGIIIYTNKAFSLLFGYSKEEIKGNGILSLIDTEDMPHHRQLREELNFAGGFHEEAYFKRKDNSKFLAETHAHIVKIGENPVVISIIRDITKRKQAEEALLRSEERFRTIFERSPIGIALFDDDGKLVTINQAGLDIFGITDIAQIKGLSIFDDPNIPTEIRARIKKLESVRFETNFDFEIVKQNKLYETVKSGKICLDFMITPMKLKKLGNIIGYLVQLQDVTEHKNAFEKIQQDELQLQKIFESLTEEVSLMSPEGRVIKTNAAMEKITGLNPAKLARSFPDFRDLKFKSILPNGTEVKMEDTAIAKVIKTKKPVWNEEVKHIWPDGSVQWISINAIPLLSESHELIGIVHSVTDITDRKSAEEEKEQFTKRLIQVQEEERKRISRDLHDEIAQKLALISLELDALREKESWLPPEILLELEKIHTLSGKTLQEVRRFSHDLRPSVLEHFGIVEALELIIDEMNLKERTGVTIKVMGRERRLPEETEVALFRIAQEALNNIRKHAEATSVTINFNFLQNKVRLTISDNGRGFAPEFEPGPISGNRLGLVGMIERAHIVGGKLQIKSIPGTGTIISVEVPYK